ncbi:hypothetical protein ABID96_002687 [Bacillus sp. OAE603]
MGKVISHQKIQQMINIKQESLFQIELTNVFVELELIIFSLKWFPIWKSYIIFRPLLTCVILIIRITPDCCENILKENLLVKVFI